MIEFLDPPILTLGTTFIDDIGIINRKLDSINRKLFWVSIMLIMMPFIITAGLILDSL